MGTKKEKIMKKIEFQVSNPLGWDGDYNRSGNYVDDGRVSNPLGWDGDEKIPIDSRHALMRF